MTDDPKAQPHVLRPKGEPRFMPSDFSISLGAAGGTDRQLLNPAGERRQPMRGFEEQYVDIIDYIVRITHRIWEEKHIGYIYDTYKHSSRVWDGTGLQCDLLSPLKAEEASYDSLLSSTSHAATDHVNASALSPSALKCTNQTT